MARELWNRLQCELHTQCLHHGVPHCLLPLCERLGLASNHAMGLGLLCEQYEMGLKYSGHSTLHCRPYYVAPEVVQAGRSTSASDVYR